jgi:hypothetical protein
VPRTRAVAEPAASAAADPAAAAIATPCFNPDEVRWCRPMHTINSLFSPSDRIVWRGFTQVTRSHAALLQWYDGAHRVLPWRRNPHTRVSSLGDAKSSLGDAESSLGDAESSRWVTLRARWVTLRARWVTLRARWVTLISLASSRHTRRCGTHLSLGTLPTAHPCAPRRLQLTVPSTPLPRPQELLLRTDATLYLQDSRGYTVCHVAAQYGQTGG